MFKKSLILSLAAASLTACTPTYEQYATYKISDNDIKQVIAKYKSFFYCFHPEAINKSQQETYDLVYRKLSEAEDTAWKFIQHGLFTNAIGKRDTDLMYGNLHSKMYMTNKWNNLYTSVNPADQGYFKCGQKDRQAFQTEFVKPMEKNLAKLKKEQEQQEKAAKAKAEKARKEREAYLKTPQGRMETQQKAMMAQQEAMQKAAMAQQQRMHDEMMAQQRAIQQQQIQMQQQQMWQQQNQYMMQQMQKAGENIGRGWAW